MSKKIFIDPGHGGADSGAVGVNNLLEKNINLLVAKKVESLLKKQNLDVKLSRIDDSTLSLDKRSSSANKWGADCYVSIHCNSFNKIASGVETFSYSTKTSDLANYIHEEILKTKVYTKNRGIKTANFYVLRKTSMRSCLVELAFIDNELDAKLLREDQDKFALAIAKGVCKYVGVEFKPESSNQNEKPIIPPVEDSTVFYRVICGSFNNRVYAEEMIEILKANGYKDIFIDIFNKK